MSPIHLHAQIGDVAPFVLLPGDPYRAAYVASRYLEDVRQYNEHRGLWGYTGRYRGVPVSVQASGMGTPSAAIVIEELVELGARAVVRIGTAGAVAPGVRPGDLIVAQGAVPHDGTTRQYLGGRPYAAVPDYALMQHLVETARALGERPHVGLIVTEDGFYASDPETARTWAGFGALAFEMESAAMFLLGKMRGIRTATVLAVSNSVGDPQLVSDDVLKGAIDRMLKVALEAAASWKEDDDGH